MDRLKRQRRKVRIRATLRGSAARPRVSVYRSNRYVSVALIDDETGNTLGSVHGKQFSGKPKMEQATLVGQALAEVAKASGVTAVVFDRGGYQYHGRVKAVAEALRQGGLHV
jgi:large subunit ribosomal protein L18